MVPTLSASPSVAVVGAGLAGVSVALELARRGSYVTLIDQDRMPMHRASRRNEGKIHLGFVFANEPGRETARLMMQGALTFGPLLHRWLGAEAVSVLVPSQAFQYLVHRDSVVAPDEFEMHCAALENIYRQENWRFWQPGYLGRHPTHLWRTLTPTELRPFRAGGEIVHGIATVEVALDTDRLADALADCVLAHPNLTWMGETRVDGFVRTSNGYRIEAERDGAPVHIDATTVVNATWERRCALDKTLGIDPPAEILHRLKYRVIARLPEKWRNAPSMTMVTGPFGDIVVRQDGTAFLSWHPVGREEWTNAIEPPRDWDLPSSGRPDPTLASAIASGILEALDRFYVGMRHAEILSVDAGPIVATGRTDVDDKASGLHHRHAVGFQEYDGFFSLDTRKLTTAPMLGCRLAVHIAERLSLPIRETRQQHRLTEAIYAATA